MKKVLNLLAVCAVVVTVPFASAQSKVAAKGKAASKPACCQSKGDKCAMNAKTAKDAKKASKGCTKCEKADKVAAKSKDKAKSAKKS